MCDSIRIKLSGLGLLAAASAMVPSLGAIPSFPGAEGWGAVTVGGRGGAVYHVTNLNNSGPGTFRAACEASGPRTVVFDVSGIIQLTNEVQITNSYITIAGQTAPGAGVIVAGETVNMTGGVSDVMVRYMRFRRSYDKAKWTRWATNTSNPDPRGQCLVGMSTTRNIMVDHVSVSWGTDENMSIYRRYINPPILPGGSTLVPTKNITIQWCISSEALNPTNHGFGDTLGGQGANHHHNLLACNVGRNPSISFSHFMDWRNNVIFNWRNRSMDGAGAEAHLNVISNYYKPGLASGFGNQWEPTPELVVRIVKPEIRTWGAEFGLAKKAYSGPGVIGWWYVNGNVVEGYPEVSSNNWEGLSLVSGKYYRGVQWDSAVQPYLSRSQQQQLGRTVARFREILPRRPMGQRRSTLSRRRPGLR
jgi:pectate lyase